MPNEINNIDHAFLRPWTVETTGADSKGIRFEASCDDNNHHVAICTGITLSTVMAILCRPATTGRPHLRYFKPRGKRRTSSESDFSWAIYSRPRFCTGLDNWIGMPRPMCLHCVYTHWAMARSAAAVPLLLA